MASTVGGLSRVTVVAPRTRLDLAMPSDIPLADLLPTLLHYAGEGLADDGVAHGGWVLSRLGGKVLDSSRTAAQLQIRDGELLYFSPAGSAPEELVFDDVVDAVATATRNRADRWELASTRKFALVFATTALLAGAVAVLLSGAPSVMAGLFGLSAALALVVTGGIVARGADDRRGGVLIALVALAYGAVGGLLVLAGHRSLGELAAPHVLVAATALVVFAALATIVVGQAGGAFVGACGSGLALGVGASICLIFSASPAAAAAVVAAATFAIFPLLPMLAYRFARLPIPSLPTTPEELRSDAEVVDAIRILALAGRANDLLTGLLWTAGAVLLGAEVVLAVAGGTAGVLLCALLAALLLLRARPHSGRLQRLPLLVAGSVGVGLTAVAVFAVTGPVLRLVAVPTTLLGAAIIALVYGLAVAGRRISPVWGRALDIVEIILITTLVPVALWVCGLYGWIRAIRP